MCGIAGIVYSNGPQEAAMAAVQRMIAIQRHRGPDGEGFYNGSGVTLGHCRLAVIDLSDAGRQPMSDPEGRYWITFNGEIYNYLELAEELRCLGYQFRGRSDTEVLLTAYRHWGYSCVQRLRGMFSFAIWDEQDSRLFAARDRLGIKPFHYWTDEHGRLAFASELKALLEFLPTFSPNARLAREFLAWNLLDHDATETMVNGILRLPPAHAMTWHSREGITLRRYWDLQLNHELDTPPAKRVSLIAEFRRRLEETISLHLRSDVPVGSCLSGGLDSSSIVCLVSRELRKRGASEGWQHTFSACFEDPHLDERRYIQAVADDTHCQTHFVFPNGKQLREEIDAWLWHQEEPVSGSSPYAQYCVARLARQHGIKVLLDGQGADEQLAGYRKFILVYLRQLLKARRYVRSVNEAIAFFLSPAILKTSGLVAGRRYLFNSVPEVDLLWPDELKPLRPAALGLGNSLDERLRADLMQFSLPTLLRYEDRNTMAFGVESRVPFVDHVFVEWLATVPVDMRLSGGWTKRVLREALVDILPKSVRTRKSKLGFLTPEREWLAGPLADWLRETLNGQHHLGDLVDVTGVKRLLMKHISGLASMPVQQILMRLAIYESWARQYLQPDRSRDRYERSL